MTLFHSSLQLGMKQKQEVEKIQNKAEVVRISTYNYSIPDKKEIGLKKY